MFTFSFGSAFAATGVDPTVTTTHNEAMAQAEKAVVSDFNAQVEAAKKLLVTEYTENDIHDNCVIAGSVYADTLDEIAADYANIVRTAASKVDKENASETDATVLANLIKQEKEIELVPAYGAIAKIIVDVAELSNLNAAGLVTYVTANAKTPVSTLQAYYMVRTWTKALDSMKLYLNGEIAKIDMKLYTDDIPANAPDGTKNVFQKSWKAFAEEEKARLEKAVADTTVSIEMSQTDAANALKDMYDTVLTGIAPEKKVATINGTIVVSYKLADTNILTADQLKADGALNAAGKAALKAEVQKQSANYYQSALQTYNASAKDAAAKKALEDRKAEAEAFENLNNLLIDEEEITQAGDLVAAVTAIVRVNDYKEVEKLATALKLQVEKEGSLKYDAAEIDNILADLQVEIYAGRLLSKNVSAANFAGALVGENLLAWQKEVVIAAIDVERSGVLYDEYDNDKYYAPEKEKVEALYEALIAKVNAAETKAQLDKIATADQATPYVATSKLPADKAAVNAKITSFVNTGRFVNAANQYIGYLNIGQASYADGYREPISGNADVAEFLAENGARTNTDVAGLLAKAEEYAKSIPTNGDTKAAKATVDELVKALPNYITLADKEAVKAAYDAAKKAGYTLATMPTKLTTAIGLVRNAESEAIDNMIDALPSKLAAKDLDAVNAIYDAIAAYNGEEMYDVYGKVVPANANYEYSYDDADDAYVAVRDAALADVHAAIAGITSNSDKAAVEAARKAVDEFVETYKDAYEPYRAIGMIENLDKLTYAEAMIKAQAIEAVEALKITAGSTAKKGSITVKWTVKGDASAVEGYEIWKSTKKNSGYKKAFTTTKKSYKNTKGLKKGTRYYYKVRAFAYVDGEKITSDWSNKAYRKAK